MQELLAVARPEGRGGSEAATLRSSLFAERGKVDANPEQTTRKGRRRKQSGKRGLAALDGLGDGIGVGQGKAKNLAGGALDGGYPSADETEDDYDADFEAGSTPEHASPKAIGGTNAAVTVPRSDHASSFKAPDVSALPSTMDDDDSYSDDDFVPETKPQPKLKKEPVPHVASPTPLPAAAGSVPKASNNNGYGEYDLGDFSDLSSDGSDLSD